MVTCESGIHLLKRIRCDLIITSPPYDDLRKGGFSLLEALEMIEHCYDSLVNGGTLVWIVADSHKNGADSLSSFRQALMMEKVGFRVNVQIYKILNPKPNAPKKTPTKDFEYIFVGHKGNPNTIDFITVPSKYAGKSTSGSNGRKDGYNKAKLRTIKDTKRHTTTWEYVVGKRKSNNATPFPLQLGRDFITMYSTPGDLVVDPMVGSGTSAVAALIEGRRFLGSDINPDRVIETIKEINNVR